MNIFVFTLLFVLGLVCSQRVNWLEHELYPCVRCLCHARSGCWLRQNCAKYSINEAYWRQAGSLTVEESDDPGASSSFRKCMNDENCIVGTIIKYTDQFEDRDCNCDGVFNCKDRAAIHLMGANCEHPEFGNRFAKWFNDCAQQVNVTEMLSKEGDSGCNAPTVV